MSIRSDNGSEYRSCTHHAMVVISSVLLALTMVITIAFPCVASAADDDEGATAEPSVEAEAAIVYSASTSETVYALHRERKLQPGSTVQLMTAMLVIDSINEDEEYDNTVRITAEMASAGSTFAEGSSVSVRDLLYAMLMTSDAEAARALAIHVYGSEADFVAQMNNKVQQLGFTDTCYQNATGAYDQDQYTTVADTAGIAQAAYRYAEIREMSGAQTHSLSLGGDADDLELSNTIPLLQGEGGYTGLYGGSTGSLTEPSKASVYLGAAVQEDLDLIVVLLGETGDLETDAAALLDYGYAEASRDVIVKANKKVGRVKVKYGEKTFVKAYTEGRGFAYIPPQGSDSLVTTETVIFDDVEAPLKKGDKVGEYRIYVADELTGVVNLVVQEDVEKGWPLSRFYISNLASVILAALGLLLLYLVYWIKREKRRQLRRRQAARERRIQEMARQRIEVEEDRRRRNWTYK